MSIYGLIKITSKIQRADTIADLNTINSWLYANSKPAIVAYGPSVRALENSVALGIEKNFTQSMPKLVRGVSFYQSIIPEIKGTERRKFNLVNSPISN